MHENCPLCGAPVDGGTTAVGSCRHCGEDCPGATLCGPCAAAGICEHCGRLPEDPGADRSPSYALADETDRAELEQRLRHHLFNACDCRFVRGDYHDVSTGLEREAARVFGPSADVLWIDAYIDMLASEFGGARPF